MLWWVANVILFVVIAPLILTLINRVLTPILEIRRHARHILDNVVTLTGELDDVPEQLVVTDEVVKQVAAGALRYSGSLGKVAGV
jgi:hypothetical protein